MGYNRTMDNNTPDIKHTRLWQIALWLAIFTIVYNLAEGVIATVFGGEAETLTLFGFGLDSFIEMISGFGILAMVLRIWRHPGQPKGNFERTALRVTGTGFYVLIAVLVFGAIAGVVVQHKPQATMAGTIISIISILVMWALLAAKKQIGTQLNSQAILADAACTQVCIYMSIVLLASSLLYSLTGLGFIDSIGSLGLAWFCYGEGREAFENAENMDDDAVCACGCQPNAAHTAAN